MNNLEKHWFDFLEGDNHALGQLYTVIFEPLVFRAISYTGDPEIARDIVSQLFSELLSSPLNVRKGSWSQVRDIKAFLVVIVRNKCLDYQRVKVNRQRILKNYANEQVSFSEDSPEKELFVKLDRCISELSADERSLLELHLNGYRNTEIASDLHLSEKTVRNKLSLTRKVLALKWHKLFILMGLLWK